jgi:DNA adenine methylase
MTAALTELKPTRPVLRYHGGKFVLAPWIISNFPPHKIYVEPYGGAASVLMQKPRAYSEVYNDLAGEVVTLFKVLRDPVQASELERLLRLTPYSRKEYEGAFASSQEALETCRRLVFRSFAGHAGAATHGRKTGFRNDTRRAFQVPAVDWLKFPDALEAMTRRLQGVVIESRPALDVLASYDGPDTLFYLDPPYPKGTRDSGDDYLFELTDEQHRALAERSHALAAMVVISGYACDLYDVELYADWHRVERKTFAEGARARTEVLWINEAAWRAKQQSAPLFNLRDEGAADSIHKR